MATWWVKRNSGFRLGLSDGPQRPSEVGMGSRQPIGGAKVSSKDRSPKRCFDNTERYGTLLFPWSMRATDRFLGRERGHYMPA